MSGHVETSICHLSTIAGVWGSTTDLKTTPDNRYNLIYPLIGRFAALFLQKHQIYFGDSAGTIQLGRFSWGDLTGDDLSARKRGRADDVANLPEGAGDAVSRRLKDVKGRDRPRVGRQMAFAPSHVTL